MFPLLPPRRTFSNLSRFPKWDEKAGLKRDAVSSRKTHSKCKRRPAMKKGSSSQQSPERVAKASRVQRSMTIGMDLGDKHSCYCVLDGQGELIQEGSVGTTKKAMAKVFGSMGCCRIAIEVGTHSPWVSRLVRGLGHETVIANPRQVKLISDSSRKDDRVDAQTLARL